MKKLLILFMLMGIVTAVNAQTSANDRDFITEQVIKSVNSIKLNSEKFLTSSINSEGFGEVDESSCNPFQYIKQPADFISIASTSYDSLIITAGVQMEDLEGNHFILEIHSDTTANQIDEADPKCAETDTVKS